MAAVPRTVNGQRVFRIKQGDRQPSLYHTALDDLTYERVQLQGASGVTFKFRKKTASPSAAVSRAAVIVTAETGELRYDWGAGDTDVAGEYYGEFEVTYPSGGPRTFPTKGYIPFVIEKDLNT